MDYFAALLRNDSTKTYYVIKIHKIYMASPSYWLLHSTSTSQGGKIVSFSHKFCFRFFLNASFPLLSVNMISPSHSTASTRGNIISKLKEDGKAFSWNKCLTRMNSVILRRNLEICIKVEFERRKKMKNAWEKINIRSITTRTLWTSWLQVLKTKISSIIL